MNAKQLIEMEKQIFETAKEWAENELKFATGENFINELKNCTTWEEAEDIANRYII